MAAFPTITTLTGLSEKTIKQAHRETSAAGYTISRGRGTVAKREFSLKYVGVSSSDKNTINTFFNTNQGLSIELTNPDPGDSTVYDVVFGQNELIWEYDNRRSGRWSVDIKLIEV